MLFYLGMAHFAGEMAMSFVLCTRYYVGTIPFYLASAATYPTVSLATYPIYIVPIPTLEYLAWFFDGKIARESECFAMHTGK